MKWKRQTNGDWLAQGQKGHFLLWRYGRIWKGLYMHEFGRVVRFRFFAKTLQEAKTKCEENYYWEA
ncbi:MAG: hypothetical protein IJY05_03070 [Clostridia bacterium]|nr:hypothetical protein [Clostridia bacterium]